MEALRLIREGSPKPSSRLADQGCAGVVRLSTAGAGPANQGSSGDLDWIVMKAAEKDAMPLRDAGRLRRDVGIPARRSVLARPPSTLYRRQVRAAPAERSSRCSSDLGAVLGARGLAGGGGQRAKVQAEGAHGENEAKSTAVAKKPRRRRCSICARQGVRRCPTGGSRRRPGARGDLSRACKQPCPMCKLCETAMVEARLHDAGHFFSI